MTSSKRQSAPAHPNWVLATTILASGLAFIDGTVVNVGLSAIGNTFKGGAADMQWVINAYLLPLSTLLLIGGAAGDRFGRTRLLVIGTTVFAAASIMCAVAPTLPLLLTGRVIQGTSAALLMPNSLAILGASFTGEKKGRAIGIWAAVGAAMAAIGPVIGGWLIDTVGWRSMFYLNLPPAIAAIVLALRFVPNIQRDKKMLPLDIPGASLATASMGAITWGLTIGSGHAGWTMPAIVWSSGGALLMIAFVLVEKFRRDRAMMPLALFGSSTFVGLTLLTLLLYGALGALTVLVPYLLIKAHGYTGTQAGSALVPFAIILTLVSPLMGRMAARIGPRLPLTIGPLIVAGGFLLLLRVGEHTNYWFDFFPAIVVMAAGMAGAVAPLTTAVLSSVDEEYTGAASGFNSAVARTAGMIATALLGSVLGATGAALDNGFHATSLVCAAASLGASASAFFLIRISAAETAHR
ncbi:MAG TPA: MFS transporter [Rudaea sp.]|nr:MFS transporter [Rudaea sp.]